MSTTDPVAEQTRELMFAAVQAKADYMSLVDRFAANPKAWTEELTVLFKAAEGRYHKTMLALESNLEERGITYDDDILTVDPDQPEGMDL